MKIKIADKLGFCFGVKRAVDITENELNKDGDLYIKGQLIHNNEEINRLESIGLKSIDGFDIKNKKVLIRSHGTSKSEIDLLVKNNNEVVDATCKYVKRLLDIIYEHYNNNYNIIIIGDNKHPEVIASNGWCENSGFIIDSDDDIFKLSNYFNENKNNAKNKYIVVSQTTLDEEKFISYTNKIKELFKKSYGSEYILENLLIFNTICSATKERIESGIKLAKEVDIVILIGGKHSSNTKKLYDAIKKNAKNIIHIEKKSDLLMTNLKIYDIIGVTASASTPFWVINEIVDYIKSLDDAE